VRRAGAQTRARYTLEYASPEVIRAVGAMRAHYVACRPSMDIWSMGVIVFEVLTGKAFFPMEYNRDAMKDGLMGVEPLPVEEDPRLFSRIPAEASLRQTVKAMLSRDTEKRPTAATVGRVMRECLKEITGEAPLTPQENSPVSTIGRASSVAAGR
jgi:serine/threonine protein kinase